MDNSSWHSLSPSYLVLHMFINLLCPLVTKTLLLLQISHLNDTLPRLHISMNLFISISPNISMTSHHGNIIFTLKFISPYRHGSENQGPLCSYSLCDLSSLWQLKPLTLLFVIPHPCNCFPYPHDLMSSLTLILINSCFMNLVLLLTLILVDACS